MERVRYQLLKLIIKGIIDRATKTNINRPSLLWFLSPLQNLPNIGRLVSQRTLDTIYISTVFSYSSNAIKPYYLVQCKMWYKTWYINMWLHGSVGLSFGPAWRGNGFKPRWRPEFFRPLFAFAKIALLTARSITWLDFKPVVEYMIHFIYIISFIKNWTQDWPIFFSNKDKRMSKWRQFYP